MSDQDMASTSGETGNLPAEYEGNSWNPNDGYAGYVPVEPFNQLGTYTYGEDTTGHIDLEVTGYQLDYTRTNAIEQVGGETPLGGAAAGFTEDEHVANTNAIDDGSNGSDASIVSDESNVADGSEGSDGSGGANNESTIPSVHNEEEMGDQTASQASAINNNRNNYSFDDDFGKESRSSLQGSVSLSSLYKKLCTTSY